MFPVYFVGIFLVSGISFAQDFLCDVKNGAVLSVDDKFGYSVNYFGVPWLTGGSVAVRSNQQWYGASDGSLVLQSSSDRNATDDVGFASVWEQVWVGKNGDPVTVKTSYWCYASEPYFSFKISFPDGAKSVNNSYITPDGVVGNSQPVFMFPSFANTGALANELGHLMHSEIWTLNEDWGFGLNHGQLGSRGPIYLYNGSYSLDGKPPLLLLCPQNSFHALQWSRTLDPKTLAPVFAIGVQRAALEIEAGSEFVVGAWSGVRGINDETKAWGGMMQRIYNTSRISIDRDPLRKKVSFWTDNGAVYFQSFWDRACNRNCTGNDTTATEVFFEAEAWRKANNVTVGISQVDTWWFLQGADVVGGGDINCADWTPRSDLWPGGLEKVTEAMPVLLYSWGFVSPENGNKMLNFTWEESLPIGSPSNRQSMVELDEVYSFYSMLRDRFLTFGGTSYEEDNLDTMVSTYRQVLNKTTGAEEWWQGFATPWCESNIAVQICESSPSDILEALKYGCVTNSRDNIDDVPGETSSPFTVRWHVGFDRMYIAALGLEPFFDNVWTVPTMPNSTWGSARENYTELAMALSVLGAGPVGYGDAVGRTNLTLLDTVKAFNGDLLKPSYTSTYLDLIYLPPSSLPFDVSKGRVFQAPSNISSSLFTTLLAVDLTSPLDFVPSMHSPPLSTKTSFLAVPWSPGFSGIRTMCADGNSVEQCATSFSQTNPLSVSTGGVGPNNVTHNFELFSVAPNVCPGKGYVLLGELSKFVRVSPVRFSNLKQSCSSLQVTVDGDPNEIVQVTIVLPSQTLQTISVPTPATLSCDSSSKCSVTLLPPPQKLE